MLAKQTLPLSHESAEASRLAAEALVLQRQVPYVSRPFARSLTPSLAPPPLCSLSSLSLSLSLSLFFSLSLSLSLSLSQTHNLSLTNKRARLTAVGS